MRQVATAEPWTLLLNGLRRWGSWGEETKRPRPMRDWYVSCSSIAVEASNRPWRGSREERTYQVAQIFSHSLTMGRSLTGVYPCASATLD